MPDAYRVERSSVDSKKWTIIVVATGRPAHGARLYDRKQDADTACATKNAAVSRMQKGKAR